MIVGTSGLLLHQASVVCIDRDDLKQVVHILDAVEFVEFALRRFAGIDHDPNRFWDVAVS